MIDWQLLSVHILTALPATIAAIAAFIQALKTHKSVNSRMDELLKAARAEARAEAAIAEKNAARKDARAKAGKEKR
jgi:hypothetical protein